MFQILVCPDGKSWEPYTSQDTDTKFEAAACAQQLVDALNSSAKEEKNKKRYRVSRVVASDDTSWMQREQQKMTDGTYKPVPWVNEAWWRRSEYATKHFVHISTKDQSMVSYTSCNEDGVNDRQTRVRPGRYLAQFFPRLGEATVAHWSAMMGGDDKELKFADTAAEAQRVYNEGPHSCMAGCGNEARAYGGPDMAVAFLEERGHITARAICSMKNKTYIHGYGDYVRLHARLNAQGYAFGGTFVGSRMRRIRVGNAFVLPHYCDFSLTMIDEGDYLRIVKYQTPGSFNRDYNGASYLQECPRCRRLFPKSYKCTCVQDASCFYCGHGVEKAQSFKDLDGNVACRFCVMERRMRYAACCDSYLPPGDSTCNCTEPTICAAPPRPARGRGLSRKARALIAACIIGLMVPTVSIGVGKLVYAMATTPPSYDLIVAQP